MKHTSIGKTLFAVALATLLFLTGCMQRGNVGESSQTEPENQSGSAPTSDSISETTTVCAEPAEQTDFSIPTESSAAPEPRERDFSTLENTIPLLISVKEDDLIRMYYLTWSLRDGALSDAEEWLAVSDDGSLLVGAPLFWNGSGRVVTHTEPVAAAPGIVPEKFGSYGLQMFGSTSYMHDSDADQWYFQHTAADSTVSRIECPKLSVPEAYAQPKLLSLEPHLADLQGDEMTLVYMVYDGASMEGDLYYVTYNIHDETSAVWGTAHVPQKYAVDTYTFWNFCRVGNSVYMAAFDTVLVLDLDTGALHTMEILDTFRADHPDYAASLGKETWEIEICGNWNGLLVVNYSFTDQDGTDHTLFLALDESHIAGILEYKWGDISLYDCDMNLFHHDDSFAGKVAFKGLNFPHQ
ncbi:MAG: hypothetical protein IJK24_05540 [Oscillospiraceae bacterium]|nr:hypothetical protein [Oscillospiraceae bacterium]